MTRRPITAAAKHGVTLRDHGRCSYRLADGRTCDSTIGVQIDHKIPVALGGSNDGDNLRLLCREHNIMEAQRMLGEPVMAKFLRTGVPDGNSEMPDDRCAVWA